MLTLRDMLSLERVSTRILLLYRRIQLSCVLLVEKTGEAGWEYGTKIVPFSLFANTRKMPHTASKPLWSKWKSEYST
jgi:hypothetical protein